MRRGTGHPDFVFVRGGKYYYEDDCPECGQIVVRPRAYFGNLCRACGLLVRSKHSHARRGRETREYSTWSNMRNRCLNRNASKYPIYGGRGIQICDRWGLFENFLADMGERPEGMTLDRIDVNGNYEPGNCRWATVSQQNSNKRAA